MIKAVLIDFGHTLVKQRTEEELLLKRGVRRLANYLKMKGYPLPVDQFERVEKASRNEADRFREKTLIEVKALNRMTVLLNRFGVPVSPDDELAQKALLLFYEPIVKDMRLYPDSIRFLRALKKEGYKLALVSNAANDIAVKEAAKRLGVAKFFDTLVISSQVEIRKPGLAIFMRALKDLNVKPSEAAFIGDSMSKDVIGAKKVPMKTILIIRQSKKIKQSISDAKVKTLTEAAEVLAAWKKA